MPSCYKECSGSVSKTSESGGWYYYKCNLCGTIQSGTSEIKYSFPCTATSLICTKTTSTLEEYALGCGKTTDTIETATIIY